MRKKRLLVCLLTMLTVLAVSACAKEVPDLSAENALAGVTSGTGTSNVSEEAKAEIQQEATEPVHEHSFETAPNGDGTHTISCTGEGCEESSTEKCAFNEQYICDVCGFAHEHMIEVTENSDGTHTLACSADYCDYSVTETCSLNEEYVCETCGFIHEHTTVVVCNNDGTHSVRCISDYCGYEENEKCNNKIKKCNECGYQFPVMVTDAVTNGFYRGYSTIEEAVLEVTGVSLEKIKASWKYNEPDQYNSDPCYSNDFGGGWGNVLWLTSAGKIYNYVQADPNDPCDFIAIYNFNY